MRSVLRRVALVAVALVAIEFCSPALAQELRLGRPSAPELGDPSFASNLSTILDREIAVLITEGEAELSMHRRQLVLARANLRTLAQQLLYLGHDAGPRGSVAVIMGATLANGRSMVDEALQPESWPVDFDADPRNAPGIEAMAKFVEAYWSISSFNEGMSRVDELTGHSVEQLDRHVAALLEPLADALAALAERAPKRHWVEREEGARTADADLGGSDQSLTSRLAAASLPPETRVELAAIATILETALSFPEFHRQALSQIRVIEDSLAYAEALNAAEWAPQEMRERGFSRLHAAILLFNTKDTREDGASQLALLASSRPFLEQVTRLANLPRNRIRPTALYETFAAVETLLDDPATRAASRRQMVRLDDVLARMIAWREMEDPAMRRELNVVAAQLDRQYEETEEALLEHLTATSPADQIGADPNLLALLANHGQLLSDLKHMHAIPGWIAKVREMRPGAGDQFDSAVRRMAQSLIDPGKRADAVRTMNDLASQMEMFLSMPFEESLSGASAEAVSMTSGQHETLLAEIRLQRGAWMDAWAAGEAGGDALSRMLLLHRLMQALADSSAVARLGGDAEWLNRWSAWEMSPGALGPAVSEIPGRLRLSVQAAVSGNVDDLQNQLQRIDEETPLAELIGRLAALVGPALEALPDDALASVEQVSVDVARAESNDALMIGRREELASICRYATEESFSRSQGNVEVADACAEYVRSLAQDLLADMAADSP